MGVRCAMSRSLRTQHVDESEIWREEGCRARGVKRHQCSRRPRLGDVVADKRTDKSRGVHSRRLDANRSGRPSKNRQGRKADTRCSIADDRKAAGNQKRRRSDQRHEQTCGRHVVAARPKHIEKISQNVAAIACMARSAFCMRTAQARPMIPTGTAGSQIIASSTQCAPVATR